MIHIVAIDENGDRYILRTFSKESDMILYFANSGAKQDSAGSIVSTWEYDSFLRDQNLTGYDIKRYAVCCTWDPETNEYHCVYDHTLRSRQIIDDNGRVLDIRDYYNMIMRRHITLLNDPVINSHRTRHKQQGRTHRKNGKCEWCVSRSKIVTDNIDYADMEQECCDHIHIKRRRMSYDSDFWNDDRYRISENNWKAAKVRKQYMWHKKPSTIKDPRSFKYCDEFAG